MPKKPTRPSRNDEVQGAAADPEIEEPGSGRASVPPAEVGTEDGRPRRRARARRDRDRANVIDVP
jgi:hypothetical protein